MTPDQVRVALGLEDFDDFAYRKRKENRKNLATQSGNSVKRIMLDINRQTGRTTEMICTALAQAVTNHERIFFGAANLRIQKQIVFIAKNFAHRANLPMDLVMQELPTTENVRRFQNCDVYEDHYTAQGMYG